jgi:hypothetical protein
MYYLIESKNQIDYLIEKAKGQCYINLITLNDNFHPKLTSLSLIYFKPENDKAYMLCLNHSDSFKLEFSDITTLLSKYDIIYTLDRKLNLYFFPPEFPILDLNFIKLEKENKAFDLDSISTKVHDYFYIKNGHNPEVNKLIPIQKHFQKQEEIFSTLSTYLWKGVLGDLGKGSEEGSKIGWYNGVYTETFYNIEKYGIKINTDKFFKHFETGFDLYSIKDDRIYTSFNLYNLTGRPTNTFNNVNFSALTKTSRVSFTPGNDIFVEFDYDGYHPRLIASEVNYIFSEKSAHEQLASLYYNTDTPTEDQIKSAKLITFRQLYGGIEEQYKDIEFFNKTNTWIEENWAKFCFGQVHLFGGRSVIDIDDGGLNINKNKLINWITQSLETYQNVSVIKNIFNLLKDKKTKLVHYTYDSFLFDVDVSDGVEIIKQLEQVLTEKGFPIKKSYGKNYKEMVRF